MSLPHTKQSHKAALRVSSRTLIEPRVEIVIERCGQIYVAWTVGKISWLATSTIVVVELGCPEPEKQSTSYYHAQAAK